MKAEVLMLMTFEQVVDRILAVTGCYYCEYGFELEQLYIANGVIFDYDTIMDADYDVSASTLSAIIVSDSWFYTL